MTGKTCTKCSVFRPYDQFPARKNMRDGHDSNCRVCYAAKARAHAAANKEKVAAKKAEYRRANSERENARVQEWKSRNPERAKAARDKWRNANIDKAREVERESYRANREARLAAKREWQQKNKARYAAYANKRRAAKLQATPGFSDQGAILEVYQECQRRSEETGIEHHVDHIIPLISKKVCGLHVSWNLRVITGAENRSKSNKLGEFK